MTTEVRRMYFVFSRATNLVIDFMVLLLPGNYTFFLFYVGQCRDLHLRQNRFSSSH